MYLLNEEYTETDIKAEENLGLVRLCAGKFKGKGIEYEELYSAGCIGLLKATKGFDSNRGVRFSTYAVPVILGEIKALFRDGGSVKVSRSLKENALRIAKERERFEREKGEEASVGDLVGITGLSRYEVAEALCAAQPTVSLTLYDREDKQSDIPIPPHDTEVIERIALKQVLRRLKEEDRKLIELRFFANMTQAAVAKQLGCTQVQVSRREKKILELLRREL